MHLIPKTAKPKKFIKKKIKTIILTYLLSLLSIENIKNVVYSNF